MTVAASALTSGESMRRGPVDVDVEAGRHPARARRHDDDAVAEPGRLAHVVGHEQRRSSRGAPDERLELGVQGVAGHRVERAERLVHQQDVGVLGERPGQRAALAHAAGQLVRPLLGEPVEVHGRRAAARPRARRSAFGTPASRIGSSTLAATVSHGNSADSWNISAVPAGDVDGARRRLVEPGDEVEDRRLAAARGADRGRRTRRARRRGRRRAARSPHAVPRPERLVDAAQADHRRLIAPLTSASPRSASTSLSSVRS